MKKIFTLLIVMMFSVAALFAQAPEKFSYQAVVRNSNNTLVSNAPVGVRVSILSGGASGNIVYSETHTTATNANGLLTIEIGSGSVQQGAFSDIAWGEGMLFLKTEIDPTGGSNYSITSVQQLLSVPYALYAKEAANGFSGDYNDLENKPQIPTVPTNVSAFTNDAGYLTSYTETDPQFNAWDKDYNDLINKPTIPTVPDSVSAFVNDAGYLTSYTEQQVLSISNDTIFLTGGSFVKLPTAEVGFSGDYNDLINKPQIPTVPTNVSAFSNDAGYLTSFTEQQILSISNDTIFLTGGSFVKLPAGFDGDYNSLTNKPVIPTVPTSLSAFVNDMGYITAIPDSLGGISMESDPIFSAWDKDYNDLINTPEIPTVPTNVSSFSNDAGYVTANQLSNANYITAEDIPAQVNADWNATEGAAQILNKPSLFSGNYNDLANKPQIPTVPTNVSAFSNDAGYITMDSIPDMPTVPTNLSAFVNDVGYITAIPDSLGGISIESDPIFSAWDKDYNDLINTPEIPIVPTNVGAFTNDAGYITMDSIPTIPTVPANVSAFTNDAGYVTASQLSSANYITAEDIPAQVNADWNATEGAAQILNKPTLFSGDYNDLTNKPTVPTVNNATLTIQRNGTSVGTFTADASTNETINIIVPTSTNELTNNSGFLTSYTETDPTIYSWAKTAVKPTYSYSEILNTPTLFDGNYNSLTNRPTIPAPANDAILTIQKNGSSIGTFTANASTNQTINVTVPTTTSELTNNSGFITSANVADMTNMINTLNNRIDSLNNVIASMGGGTPVVTPGQPTVVTGEVTNITTSTATCAAEIPNSGGLAVTDRGVCWSLNPNPTLAGQYVAASNAGTGSFTVNISGLSIGSTYYVRAYATNSLGTTYGNQVIFYTPTYPTVTTADVVAGGSNTAAGGGNVTATGGAEVTARGVCWSIYPNPTLNDAHTTDGTGIGSFSSVLTGLSSNVTYYVRAYATNLAGTSYGEQKTVFAILSEMPVVETVNVTNVEISTVTFNGNVLFDGGYPVTERGFCYGTMQNPTVDDAITSDGTGNGSFSHDVNGLTNNTTYYVRAFATNLAGTSYGAPMSFTTKNFGLPCSDMPTIVDVDGNTYHTIQINDQCWMKENLRTTKKPDGTDIPLDNGRRYPSNNANNVAVYGYLYTWSVMMNGATSSSANPSGVQGICPSGWHVPSNAEWYKMTNYLSSQDIFYCNNSSSNIAKVLAATTGWNSTANTCAVGNNQSSNNATGFGALPAGAYSDSDYTDFGLYAHFWSATQYDVQRANKYHLSYTNATVLSAPHGKAAGYSVRCLRD